VEIKSRKKENINILLIVLLVIAFTSGALMARMGFFTKASWCAKMFLKNPLSFPGEYTQIQLQDVERLYIDIGFEDFQKLAYWKELAIEKGMLYGVDHDYVAAQIRHKQKTIPARIRLKGAQPIYHFQDYRGGDKWSMRIRIRGDNALFGMKNFALMSPKRRSFMLEWFLRRLMKEEGVISKRYKFVELIINGENKGIYALDEHFDSLMLEANERREGPVIRLAQEAVWSEGANWSTQLDDYYFALDIDAFGSRKIMDDELFFKQLQKAGNLYKAFRRGDLSTSEVFDIDKLAKWMAISDIIGGFHGFIVCDMRFYYNPITSKLEPCPDDSFNELQTDPISLGRVCRLDDQSLTRSTFVMQLFDDLAFAERYMQELERVSQKSYLENVFNVLGDEIEENVNILRKDQHYLYYEFPKGQLYRNQEYIRKLLNPYKGIMAHFEGESDDSIILNIASVKIVPSEILSVTYKDNIALKPKKEKIVLKGREFETPLTYNSFEFSLPEGFSGIQSPSELVVNYRILGTTRLRKEAIHPYHSYDASFFANDLIRQEPNYEDFDFVKADTTTKQILLKRGHWVLEKPLIIPAGYTFVINAGTNLDLVKNARILSYSPVQFMGSDDHPITIYTSDSTGQGITVLGAEKGSFLRNVVFKNLSQPLQGDWQLTGAVTFYESPVTIDKCRFLGCQSEDSLNIIRSKFSIDNSLFADSVSDALDVDFGKGSILNTSFTNSTNDAVDFSGSAATVSKSFIDGAGDKGISVGENSQIVARHIEIKNAAIGVASKDFSQITIENIQIYNTKIGFTAYQKKPEFGPATISVGGVNFMDVATMYLIEEGSLLLINSLEGTKRVPGMQKDIAKAMDKIL